jgi:hypothetical protein
MQKVLPAMVKKPRAEATTDCDSGTSRIFVVEIVIRALNPNERRQIGHEIRLPGDRL